MKRGKIKRGGPVPKTKTSRLSQLLKLTAYSSLGLGAGHSMAESVITFEGFTGPNLEIATVPDYGDNISASSPDWNVTVGLNGVLGTPNITIDWITGGWQTYTEWDGRGTVAQTDFNTAVEMSLLFTPGAGAGVRLVSFQLDEWVGGGDGSIIWSVIGTVSGELASGLWTMGNAGGRTTIAPDVAGRIGENVSLNIELRGGAPSYFALDNLTFDQVPEPSTLALGALGAAALGAAAMRKRRRA